MDFLSQASILVSLPQDSDLAIPSKVFEYMRFDAWLLALAERGSATEMVLRHTSADIVAPADSRRLAAILEQRFLQYRVGELPKALSNCDLLSRRRQAGLLYSALDDLARHSPLERAE